MSTRYVCTGGCNGAVSEEEFQAGKTACGTEGCAHHGQPFEKQMDCDNCGAECKEGENHACPA